MEDENFEIINKNDNFSDNTSPEKICFTKEEISVFNPEKKILEFDEKIKKSDIVNQILNAKFILFVFAINSFWNFVNLVVIKKL